MVNPAAEQISLADAKAHLSKVVEGIETEHRRVVITEHGRPSVVMLAVEDLEAIEDGAVVEFCFGRLTANTHRVGHPLGREFGGWYSARIGAYRVIYWVDWIDWIDEDERIVYVDRVDHRSNVYPPK